MHDRLRGIRRVVEEYDDRMIVGEVALQDLHRVVSFLNSGDQLHLAHNFVFAELDWDAEAFAVSIDDFEALASDRAWPAWFLENHDRPRIASRFDVPPGLGAARARAALLMLYALRGTPFVYQGQELGLPDAEIPPGRVVDVDGRDPERAPMPWRPPSAAGPGAGFTTGEPWLPLVAEAEALNAETQAADERSTLALARRLAALRRESAGAPARVPADGRPRRGRPRVGARGRRRASAVRRELRAGARGDRRRGPGRAVERSRPRRRRRARAARRRGGDRRRMSERVWWRDGVLYQLYPRSFADSDGDGIGDLRGVIDHLDHFAWLGIDGIWLNPTFPSPNADWGFDVADYRGVDPALGTLDDLDALIAAAGERGIKRAARPRPEPHERRAPVVRRGARGARRAAPRLVRVARTRPPAAARRTTGRASSAARRGSSTRGPASTTCTSSTPSSRTSTGGTTPSAPSSRTSSAGGTTAASPASASTSPTGSSRTASCATTPRRARTTRRPTAGWASVPSSRCSVPRSTTSSGAGARSRRRATPSPC